VYDLLIAGGRLLDPDAGIDEVGDLAIANDRIVALGTEATRQPARETLRADGLLVTPGLIDLHVHAFEYATDYGVPADAVGVRAGVTTIVDQGSVGWINLPAFRRFIVDDAATETLAFLNVSSVGSATWTMPPAFHGPDSVDVAATTAAVAANRDLVRGIKTHAEIGGYARWGTEVVARARAVADASGVPIYVHTGLLFPLDDRPAPAGEEVFSQLVPLLREGDVLCHCFTRMPGGILGDDGRVVAAIKEAVARGVHLDVAHGAHFSFAHAERVLADGVRPYLASSDVHADFDQPHSRTAYYGLTETLSKLLALGLPLAEVVAMATSHPARVLGESARLGSLSPGHQADVSLLAVEEGAHVFPDMAGEVRGGRLRLLPRQTVKAGRVYAAGAPAAVFGAATPALVD
jgi:dihydroorotase